MECEPVGVLLQKEDNQEDNNILAALEQVVVIKNANGYYENCSFLQIDKVITKRLDFVLTNRFQEE